MDLKTFFIVIGSFLSWGIGAFFSKLATNKIGQKAVFFDMIIYAPVVILYSLMVFKFKNLVHSDKSGILFGVLAGLIGSFGLVGFYHLLAKDEVSTILPLVALYPAVTIILAVIFLHETMTLTKGIGILFSLVAIYLLAR